MPDPPAPPVLLVSNRGPVSFTLDEHGEPIGRRGGGGLVSGLAPLVAGTGTRWLAAAMSHADRVAASRGTLDADGLRVRLLDLAPDTYRQHYDVVCNGALWFAHHGLFDATHLPRFDHRWRRSWDAYREVNEQFADAVAEDAPDGATVLVQDYHLCLMAPTLRRRRPDLRVVHFAHTPFAGPDDLVRLPTAAVLELLEGLCAHHACGFHTGRWARRFEASCRELLGGTPPPPTFVSPLAADPADLERTLADPATAAAGERLDRLVGDRRLVVRVDRIEPSKNLLRGFHAVDDLFERYPRWRGRVVLGAFLYPSRDTLPEYLAYRQETETLIARINERWATADWTPVLADLSDDYPTSLAALARYDVLLVNPIRDGLNLVAKEGPLVNGRDGVLVLSRQAGSWDELGDAALGVNPFDVAETADALAAALELEPAARARQAATLRARARTRTPADWLADQQRAADPGPPDTPPSTAS